MSLVIECHKTESIGMDEHAVSGRILNQQGPAGYYGRIIVPVIVYILAKGIDLILVVVYDHIAESLHLAGFAVIYDAVTYHAAFSLVLLNDRTVQQDSTLVPGVETPVTGIDDILLVDDGGGTVQIRHMGICIVMKCVRCKSIIRTLHRDTVHEYGHLGVGVELSVFRNQGTLLIKQRAAVKEPSQSGVAVIVQTVRKKNHGLVLKTYVVPYTQKFRIAVIKE